MYCCPTSTTLWTLSARYPSTLKLFPYKNSSSSGHSFLITRPVPPFHLCTTFATILLCFIWMITCRWSSGILSSLVHHVLIQHASFNSRLKRMTISPRSTSDDISVSTPGGTVNGVRYGTQFVIWPRMLFIPQA